MAEAGELTAAGVLRPPLKWAGGKRLYEHLGFTLTYLQAPRRISCNGDRTPAQEVLAMRNVMRNA